MSKLRDTKLKRKRRSGSTVGLSPVEGQYNEPKPILSVAEYRKLLNDDKTSDDRILERIEYLVGFTRKVARGELEKYVQNKNKK